MAEDGEIKFFYLRVFNEDPPYTDWAVRARDIETALDVAIGQNANVTGHVRVVEISPAEQTKAEVVWAD
jgi:hypothetical protein